MKRSGSLVLLLIMLSFSIPLVFADQTKVLTGDVNNLDDSIFVNSIGNTHNANNVLVQIPGVNQFSQDLTGSGFTGTFNETTLQRAINRGLINTQWRPSGYRNNSLVYMGVFGGNGPIRVGIGVSSPNAALDVGGGVRVGDSIVCNYDARGTIRFSVTSLEYCNGMSWVSTNSGAGTLTGTISPNYVPKASSTTNFVNSQIYDDGVNVGVATTAPTTKLDVSGAIRVGGTGSPCTSSIAGALRYDSALKVMEFCNSTNWNILGNSSSIGGDTGVTLPPIVLDDSNHVMIDVYVDSRGYCINSTDCVTSWDQISRPYTGTVNSGQAGKLAYYATDSVEVTSLDGQSNGAIYYNGAGAVQSGTLPIASGGTGATTAAAALTNLGFSTVGQNLINLAPPVSAQNIIQIDNFGGVSTIDTATLFSSFGSVTSVGFSGGSTGLTASGSPITSSGTITLGGTLGVANGGTGVTTSTGSGSVVLSSTPTITSPSLVAATATTLVALTSISSPSFIYTSDERVKKNIEPLSSYQNLQKVLVLNPVSFEWKNSSLGTSKHLGLVAQDVEKIYPELVVTNSDGYKSVEYGNVVAPLIAAVQEQQKQIYALNERIAQLEANQNK